MVPVRKGFCVSVSGLIRIFTLCFVFSAMFLQVAHRGEFELPGDSMLFSAVSATFNADSTHEEPVDKAADLCAAGSFSCHATAVLVPEETALHLVLAAGPNILTGAKMVLSRFVDVPLQPPLIRRV